MMAGNVRQAIPFLWVTDMARALRFYVDGLGFTLAQSWMPEGTIEWCRLELDVVALMLQVYRPDRRPDSALGVGVVTCFQCDDALSLYRGFCAKGLAPQRPFVGNNMWVVAVLDPDGYRFEFASPTDVAEETDYDPAVHN